MYWKWGSWTKVKHQCNYWSQTLSSEDDDGKPEGAHRCCFHTEKMMKQIWMPFSPSFFLRGGGGWGGGHSIYCISCSTVSLHSFSHHKHNTVVLSCWWWGETVGFCFKAALSQHCPQSWSIFSYQQQIKCLIPKGVVHHVVHNSAPMYLYTSSFCFSLFQIIPMTVIN